MSFCWKSNTISFGYFLLQYKWRLLFFLHSEAKEKEQYTMKQICTVRLCDKRPPAHSQRNTERQCWGPKFLPGLPACPQPSAHQRPISTNHEQHKSRWESKLRIQRKGHTVQAPPSVASGKSQPQCPSVTPTTTTHQEKLYRAPFRLRAVAV